ncbi:hypothetical protein [Amycolatopsis keratiniphila]|uniref:hypothetical protein n=1 Tax=Amycolatopsis keratiniphila TaxID=129921 RepID=UPI000A4DC623|nr:hypothetical protein [Amycolatopsis keratiniphila]
MPGSREVLVLHDDGFGTAVAERLGALPSVTTRATPGLPSPGEVPARGVLVLALNQPAPRFEREADRLALARDAFLIPVIASHQAIRLGPVLGPGAHATMDCHYRRTLQHHTSTGSPELHAAYDEVEHRPSAGFLPSLAASAASWTAAVIHRLAEGDPSDLQQVTYFSGTSARIGRHRLTGVHGNARSEATVPVEDRSWQALLPLARELAQDIPAPDAVAEGAAR